MRDLTDCTGTHFLEMFIHLLCFSTILYICVANDPECKLDDEIDEDDNVQCGFDPKNISFKLFPSARSLRSYSKCARLNFLTIPLKFCIKPGSRRYDVSCPVFCPNHYSPVCGASKLRDYIYRTFTNRCHFDMLNCRGEDEITGYVEVPLEFCQDHSMKNIFKEQAVLTRLNEYEDYE